MTPLPGIWAKHLAAVLAETGVEQIVDLGSGSGGPTLVILREIRKSGRHVKVILSDLYPDLHCRASESEPGVQYWPEPVDAAQVPDALWGVRTMFASFHHCSPEVARGILRNAFLQRQPICIFEMTSRTFLSAASTVLVPLAVWIITPRVRPLSLFQLVFTYLVPVLPLLVCWDAFVSQLRTYMPEDFRAMTADLIAGDYCWECHQVKVPHFPSPVPYLIGKPIRPENAIR